MPYLPSELVEMSFSSDDYDEDNESEEESVDPGNTGGAICGENSEEDATSETLVEDSRQTLGYELLILLCKLLALSVLY